MLLQLKAKPIAVGIDYTDILIGQRKVVKGGINNYCGQRLSLGTGKCAWDENFKKIAERVRCNRTTEVPKNCLVMYGDKVSPSSFFGKSFEFLAVDFAKQYHEHEPPQFKRVLEWWKEIAHLLVFSIRDKDLQSFNEPNTIAHCSKGVYYSVGNNRGVVENRYRIDGLKYTIGAGDYFLSTLFDNLIITEDSIDLANKKTAEYLRRLNQ